MIFVRTHRGERRLELEEFEAEVRAGSIRPSTQVRVPMITGGLWVSARDLELFKQLYAPAEIRFARTFSLGRFPYVTVLLCVGQVVLFLTLSKGTRVLPLDTLLDAGAKVGANILELGETWRLLTANVLHRDVLHLAFNTFFLFNVGGTVENAYRTRDYLVILLGSALGTTVLSLAMSSVPSVGASGIVLGLFGSASVFGYKYGELLPRRYRRYFGGAVLPFALFILYVGLSSPDTDNWGHVGGLVAGAGATAFLSPRLLHGERESWMAHWASGFALIGLLALVLGAGSVVRGRGPQLNTFVDDTSGIAVAYPVRWESGENHLGDPAWGNRLGVSLGLRVERRAEARFTLDELRASFLAELEELERTGELAKVEIKSERPFLVEGGRGLELEIYLASRAGPQRTRNYLVERGYYSYRMVLSAPEARDKSYGPVFDRLVGGLRLEEPAGLRASRRVAETFPGMSSAQVELGDRLAEIGNVQAAARAYQRALASVPDLPEALYGLARLSLAYGSNLEAADLAAAQLLYRRPRAPAVVALAADIKRRLGQRQEACLILQGALERLDGPLPKLRRRLDGLHCAGRTWAQF